MHGVNVSLAYFHGELHKNHVNTGLFGPERWVHDDKIDYFWFTIDGPDISIDQIKRGALKFFFEYLFSVMDVLLVKLKTYRMP